jgi:flagellar assembly factor FliW
MLSTAAIADQSTDATANSQILAFPEGLVGCQDWKNFVLLSDDEENLPVACLQSVDQPRVRLLVTDPRLIDNNYSIDLTEDDYSTLGVQNADDTALFCTLSVTEDGSITANLLGPLVVNKRTRRGRQVVLSDSGYSTRHPVARLQGE